MKISKEELKQIIVEEVKKAMVDPTLKEMKLIPKGGGVARTCPELGEHLGEKWASGNFDGLNLVPGTDLDTMLRSASRDFAGGDDTLLSRDAARLEAIANGMAEAAGMQACRKASQNEGYIAAFKKTVLGSAAGTKSKYADIKPSKGAAQLPRRGPNAPIPGEPRMAAESLTKEIMKALQEAAK